MTTRTSPPPTVSPAATLISFDRAGGVGVDLVLHLHRLEHDDTRAGLDLLADLDEHLDDRALHRRLDAARPGPAARPDAPRWPAFLAPRRGCRHRGLGHPHADVEPLPVHLDRRRSRGPSARPRRRAAPRVRPSRHAGEVEALLDPLRRVLDRREVGVAQDRQVGGDRRGDALDHSSLERRDRARDRHVAVAAPHDQLADQVVVVLADLVAGVVPGVEAHTESVGRQRAW